jgi:hypothetical protein
MISPMLLDSTDFDWISPINVEADFTDKIGSKLIMINLVSENFFNQIGGINLRIGAITNIISEIIKK